MSLLYDVLRYLSNCFRLLRIFYIVLHLTYLISVFFEIFKKTNSILCFKYFIYLFVFHMLDYMLHQIMIALTQYFFFFFKITFSTFFFSIGIVLLVFFFFLKGKSATIFYFSLSFLFSVVVLLSFINFLNMFLGVFDCIVLILVQHYCLYNK